MSFGSTMQFVRTGTSASCGPTAAPAIAGAATTATLYPYGYRGVATPTKAQTVRQRAAYAGNGFMPLERVESAVSSFADKALARVTKAMTPMDLRLKTQARSGAPAPGSVWDGICYDAESGRVWQKGTSYWSNATLKQDLGTYAWVDVQGFGSYMVENCPGYGRTQPWRAKKFAQPSVRAKRQSADAIRLSTGSGSGSIPSAAEASARHGSCGLSCWSVANESAGSQNIRAWKTAYENCRRACLAAPDPGTIPGLPSSTDPKKDHVCHMSCFSVVPQGANYWEEPHMSSYRKCISACVSAPQPGTIPGLPSVKKHRADAIRLSSGSGSTKKGTGPAQLGGVMTHEWAAARQTGPGQGGGVSLPPRPALATFDPREVLLRRQAFAGAQRDLYAPFDPRNVYRRTRAVSRGHLPAGVSTGFAGAGCGSGYYAGGGCGCTGG